MMSHVRSTTVRAALALGVTLLASSVAKAAPFYNLDFELAKNFLPPIPEGSYGGMEGVEVTNALPGWSVYVGSTEQTRVLHNNMCLGSSCVAIIAPEWSWGIAEGECTPLLQAGPEEVSIAQIGNVPASARSIRFLATPNHDKFTISIGGQQLNVVVLSTNGSWATYGADISQYAGSNTELRVTHVQDFSGDTYNFSVDAITFSAEPIPVAPVVNIASAVEVFWASSTGLLYQVQWCDSLDTNQWYALGSPVSGNGTTNAVFDATRGSSQRFYRLLVVDED